MQVIHMYTIWEKTEDLVANPVVPKEYFEEPEDDTWTDGDGEVHDLLIFDPSNPTGIRYQAIKVVHDITVARAVCENPNGKYVYTISDAFYGENY